MSTLQEKTFKTIYTSFIYCSVVLFIVSFFMKDSVKLDINIASYSILASAIILVSCIILLSTDINYFKKIFLPNFITTIPKKTAIIN